MSTSAPSTLQPEEAPLRSPSSTAEVTAVASSTPTKPVLSTGLPTSSSHISAVSLKIPPFWPADPQLWFAQLEAQFTIRHITSEHTRFHYVASSLSQEHAHEVRDLLLSPPHSDPYSQLKEQLTTRLSASASRRVRQLLTEEQLGDRSPSQFLRHLQRLKGDTPVDDQILLELFLARLPSHVRMVLTTASSLTLEKQAALADQLMDIGGHVSASSVSSVHGASSVSALSSATDSSSLPALRAEVAALREQLASLSTALNSRSRRRSISHSDRSRSRSRSTGRSQYSEPPPGRCWYHHRFGPAARSCRPPCDMQQSAENGQASQ